MLTRDKSQTSEMDLQFRQVKQFSGFVSGISERHAAIVASLESSLGSLPKRALAQKDLKNH